MAKEDSGYLGNNLLKKVGTNVEWTQEMVSEWIRCKDDPVYFTEKYIKIINLNDGLVNFIPYDYQREIISTVHSSRYTIVTTGRQSGKCFEKNQRLTLKNKKTGEIISLSAIEFKNILQSKDNK